MAAFAVSSVQAVGATKCTTPTMGETYEVGAVHWTPTYLQPQERAEHARG